MRELKPKLPALLAPLAPLAAQSPNRMRIDDLLCSSPRLHSPANSPRTSVSGRSSQAGGARGAWGAGVDGAGGPAGSTSQRVAGHSSFRKGDGQGAGEQGAEQPAERPPGLPVVSVGAEEGTSFFTVRLFVAALGEGKVLPDAGRKKHDILEQVVRNVSKEQNTIVKVSGEGSNLHLKMRVFVENSIEAKAVADYIATHPHQVPAPFVILSQKLHIAVSYYNSMLDPSCASVADRLRKQAKTRAVKILREAIADPGSAVSCNALKGFMGPHAPAMCLDKYVLKLSSYLGSDRSRSYVVFPAKNKCGSEGRVGNPRFSHAPNPVPEVANDPMQTAFFPVSLFVTAIADGALAADISSKARDRLEQILCKIPKEQHTCVEVQGEGTMDIKLRVFVNNSEDAKAVNDYIKLHMQQVPAPFVVLAQDLPMAVLYDPSLLDLNDSSVADRLRKQAKTRAVKLVREVIAQHGHMISCQTLRGYQGAFAPAKALDRFMKDRATILKGQNSNKKYIAFSARSKACSLPLVHSGHEQDDMSSTPSQSENITTNAPIKREESDRASQVADGNFASIKAITSRGPAPRVETSSFEDAELFSAFVSSALAHSQGTGSLKRKLEHGEPVAEAYKVSRTA